MKNINDINTLPIAHLKYKGDTILFQSMDNLQIACGYNEKIEKNTSKNHNVPSSSSSKEPILWRFRIVIISLIILSTLIATVIINELTS